MLLGLWDLGLGFTAAGVGGLRLRLGWGRWVQERSSGKGVLLRA